MDFGILPTHLYITMLCLIGLLGIIVGSFLNVCILRIPQKESVVTVPSHCTHCNKRLKWWELIPLFSYLFLGGRCSKCKSKISAQYPIVEATNGLLWLLVFVVLGFTAEALISALLTSALLVLTVIDARTLEIPIQTTVFIAVLGMINTALNLDDIASHLLGFGVITAILLLLLFLSNGRAIGGGDVKLMAGCGLFLGLLPCVFAFITACVIGSIIHVVRIKFFNASRTLAMGPYLSVGVFISLLWGRNIIDWYIALLVI